MNTQKLLMGLGVGLVLYYFYQRSQQPALAKPPPTTALNPLQLPDLSLPPVQAWPVCPAGQYYDPNLQMCMTAPGAYAPQCNLYDSSGCPPGMQT